LALRADALVSLAFVFFKQNRLSDAQRNVEDALAMVRDLPRTVTTTKTTATGFLILGIILFQQGQLTQAQNYLDQSLGLSSDAETKSLVLIALSAVHLTRGQLEPAQTKLQDAEDLTKNPETKNIVAMLMGTILFGQGQLSAAELKFKQGILATNPDTRAGALVGMAHILFNRFSQRLRAEQIPRPATTPIAVAPSSMVAAFEQVWKLFRSVAGKDWDAAKAMLEDAVQVAQQSPVRANALVYLGQMLVMEGQYGEARKRLALVLNTPQLFMVEANARLGIAFASVFEKDFSTADAEADKALALVTTGPRRANAPLTADDILVPSIAQQVFMVKALAAAFRFEPTRRVESLRLILDAGRGLRLSMELVEQIRAGIGSPAGQISYLALVEQQGIVDLLPLIALGSLKDEKLEEILQTGDQARLMGFEDRIQLIKELFQLAEQGRARVLLDLLARKRGETIFLPSPLRDEEQARLRKVSDLQNALTSPTVRNDALRSELGGARKDFNNFVDSLRRHKDSAVRAYAVVKYPKPPSVEEVQARLNDQEILLEFRVTSGGTYLWVVRRTGPPRLIQIRAVASDLRAQVTALINNITRDPFATFDAGPAKALYDLLLRDALSSTVKVSTVKEGTSLIIVADDALQQLPFEVLVTDGISATTPQYLGAKYPVTYYPSAGTLVVQRSASEKRQWPFPLLAVADPTAPTLTADTKTSLSANLGRSYIANAENRGYRFPSLPAARREVEDIARLFKINPTPPDVLIGEQATKAMLLERKEEKDPSKYRFIHLATHGLLGTDIPGLEQPALLLRGERGDDGPISLLTMDEIMKLRLTAEMVVLSACQTGRGEVVPGEGVMGLTRAFLYAGAQSVVASLWNVADEATAVFMSRFYNYLLNEGMDKAHALQKVRMDFISGSASSEVLSRRGVGGIGKLAGSPDLKASSPASISTFHPYFWAPFILVGDGK
jgi:CHAT domain-containing protein/predicted negative regulator of RcsB-dependent stress response